MEDACPRRAGRVALLAVVVLLLGTVAGVSTAAAAPGWQWYKVDAHTHSVVSADAFPDLGMQAYRAKAAGYSALFQTDHSLASDFPISGITANTLKFDDVYGRWTPGTFGSLTSSTNALVSTPVKTGSSSLRVKAESSSSGEAFVWTKRGPNFRSGDITLKVSIYPTRIDPGSGVYVSASIGQDASIAPNPVGYTTQAGVPSPGKSTVLVWQLGSARTPSSDPNRRVITHSLGPYTLNAWNTYTINVTQALEAIPVADRPLAYNALSHLKLAAAGNGGSAEAYFDAYSLLPSAPQTPANEFAYRNSIIHDYDTSTFKIFPAVEMGVHQHANRFNFDFSDPGQFVAYPEGIDGIFPTQQSAYPVQLNHPGWPGGVSAQTAIDTGGNGADLMEVAKEEPWSDIWDDILKQGIQIIGTETTDKHEASYGTSSMGTIIYAPALESHQLLRSLFEGRAFFKEGNVSGMVLGLPGASEPYPARYPIYASPDKATADVRLSIASGLSATDTVRWIVDDQILWNDTAGSSSYAATKSIPLPGSFTYVRAEVRSSTGAFKAGTEPIFFRDVGGLPADKTFNVDGVVTADGLGYTKLMTKGITTSAWDATARSLSFTLANPVNALVDASVKTGVEDPQRVLVDGAVVPAAATAADLATATASSWHFDPSMRVLRLKVRQGSAHAAVKVEFGTAAMDSQSPGSPTGLTATAAGSTKVDLAWSAVTDNVGVTGYRIYRNGPRIATVAGNALTYSDTSVAAATSYSYTVDAIDAAGNNSALSAPASVTTPAPAPTPTTLTFAPTADSTVEAPTPGTNFGLSAKLRTDGSPDVRSYLRFNLSGLGPSVSNARLRIYANTANSLGYAVRGVTDSLWGETTINYNNAPAVGPIVRSSGTVPAGAWTELDITSLVTKNGLLNLALTSSSATATSYGSRESGATAPRLIVTSS